MTEKPSYLSSSNNIAKYAINSCIAELFLYYIAKVNSDFSFVSSLFNNNVSANNSALDLSQELTSKLIALLAKKTATLTEEESETSSAALEDTNKFKTAVVTIKTYNKLVQLLMVLNNESDNLITAIINLKLGELDFIKTFNQKNSSNDIATEILNLLNLIPKNNKFEAVESTISALTSNGAKLSSNDIIVLLDSLDIAYQNSLVYLLLISNKTEEVRILLLGKTGILTEAAKSLAKLDPEERKLKGTILNGIKNQITAIISLTKKEIAEQELQQKLQQESIDVTLPVYSIKDGGLHPLTKVLEEVVTIFSDLGFKVAEGPEIEDEWYNFSALNFGEFHPAKDSHDTFYCNCDNNNQDNKGSTKKLLRTHTSNVQIREMQKGNLPLQIIAPGKVYRNDDDATHTPMFHQIEGLYINKTASIAELKYVLTVFCEKFFAVKNVPLRFRPSYFPFTSPSLEVDIGCKFSKNGVVIGEGSDWLEILGCGMVHPNVLKNCNIDPKEYKGFAFGMGLERIAMLKYGFPDLREFFSSNYLWLKAYNFSVIKSLLQ